MSHYSPSQVLSVGMALFFDLEVCILMFQNTYNYDVIFNVQVETEDTLCVCFNSLVKSN